MIYNLTKKRCISRNPFWARGFIDRGRGMIGRNFSDFDAMVFENCASIHTMFMSIHIDVLFVTPDNIVCGIRTSLRPWLPLIRENGAATVLEMPVGCIERTCTEVGDFLDLNAELDEKQKERILNKPMIETVKPAMPFSESGK